MKRGAVWRFWSDQAVLREMGVACLIIFICFSAGCTNDDGQITKDQLVVAVTIPPMKEMAEAIGGERVSVIVVIPPGSDPHTFEPTPGQITRISSSKVFFRLGDGLFSFEDRLVDRLSSINPNLNVVDLSDGIMRIREDGGEESHVSYDPHIWLSPRNGAIMAGSIASALITIDPASEPIYLENLREYLSQINETDLRIQNDLTDLRVRKFIVTHDAWRYFAQEYNIEQIAVHVGGKEPNARDLQEIIQTAHEEEISVIFIEPQFSQKSAEVIAEAIGGVVVMIDPLAESYLKNFIQVAELLEGAMK